ncbi:MAG: ATP-binding cassette domain-containing protein [Alphaproteobacteria bacterium]|nr:ATP-binding cassette domain-containing protein [Alphaproteobacteria bacterium]
MSDDYLIHTRGLTKTYRMHKRPSARLASLFSRDKASSELVPGEVFHALRGIDLDIRRGEKVAIIGRNGAGKSTLLKIITGVIKPTTGTIDVRGKSHALLSLGAGFHPDFTGRENAEAFLAHMGIGGRQAEALLADAVAFAEIEEHIDQPLKTYSTGMQARLMFAVSTALNPELLVIDEVLGVGDAYFQNKSFERIREMCASGNTTLLLVSHDIYSAAKLANRIVWIEKGRVMGDGDPVDTIKAYENSIRLQEDARQKQKLALDFRRQASDRKSMLPAFIEIRARGNEPAKSPVYFADAGLFMPDGKSVEFPIFKNDGSALTSSGSAVSVQLLPHLPWGPVQEVDGTPARPWNNFGAVEHKAGFAIFPLSEAGLAQLDSATLYLKLRSNDFVDADAVYIAPDGSERILHRILLDPNEFHAFELPLKVGSPATSHVLTVASHEAGGRQGSGRCVIADCDIRDGTGETSFLLQHGQPVTVSITLDVVDPDLNEQIQVLFAFRRNGIEDVARTICRDISIAPASPKRFQANARFDHFPLGPATYTLTVLVAREGYYENHSGLFFAINPDVYDSRRDILQFEVVDRTSLASQGTGAILNANWSVSTGDN